MDVPSKPSQLAQPTRARLFAILQELRRAATSEELAAELGMHVNGVRRHLERMQAAGLLDRRQARHGRGRPRDEWSIAPGANPEGERPEGYSEIAGWLIRAMPAGSGQLRRVERTGREIGRELAPDSSGDLAESVRQAFAALGFQPEIGAGADGRFSCELHNCPYRDSARESPEIVCTLHKGITVGLLEGLDPKARLERFEPHDPDEAGCLVEVVGGSGSGAGE